MSAEIIRGMPEAEYRARPEISQSIYKLFGLPTLAHTKFALEQEKEPTDSMTLGTCLHSLVLENTVIYAVMPKVDLRTTIGKATKAQFESENVGKVILTTDQAAKVEGMARGIERCPEAMELLKSCPKEDREVSIFWGDNKARLDGPTPIGPFDLKSTTSADGHEWERSVLEYGYHIQAAMYLEAAMVAGFCADDFRFIAIESCAPYVCGVIKMPHEHIEYGRQELERLRARRIVAMREGYWPGYKERTIGLPGWKVREYEKENY